MDTFAMRKGQKSEYGLFRSEQVSDFATKSFDGTLAFGADYLPACRHSLDHCHEV